MPEPSKRKRGNPQAWERYSPELVELRPRDLAREAARWEIQERRFRFMLEERGRDPIYIGWFVDRERELFSWSWDAVYDLA